MLHLAAVVAPFPAVTVLTDDLASSSPNLALMTWDYSDSGQEKSLLDHSTMAAATPAGVVPFLEALLWPAYVPLFKHQGKP